MERSEERFTKKHKVRTSRARHVRQRVAKPGIMLQLDGSYHKWFGGKDSCLITAIDDCTNELYYAGFYKSESTLSCMEVLKKIIEKKGLFDILYVDKAGTYGGGKRQLFSNLKRACEELGIIVLFANSPEAKGRIERLFRTLQDRLIPEMRVEGIQTKKQADEFIKEYIENDYKSRFTIDYNGDTAFREAPSSAHLNEVFCIKEKRCIGKDHTFKKDSVRFAIKNPPCSLARRDIEIRTYLDETTKYFFLNRELEVEEFIDYLEVA